jgi:predicted nucleotidyltransferase/DNA-binding XRE family transcriptional regulator
METSPNFTPETCRMARARLRLSQQALARRAGVSRATLVNFEAGRGKPLKASVAAIRSALGEGPRLARVLRALQAAQPKLEEMGVEHLAVFGSVARMEDGPESDVDVIVDVDPARHLDILDLVGIASALTDMLGIKVDVVERRPKMKPELAGHIAEDQVYAF